MSKPLGQRRSRLTDLRFSSTRFRSDDAPAARRRLYAKGQEMAALRYGIVAIGVCVAGLVSAGLLLFTLSLLIDLLRR